MTASHDDEKLADLIDRFGHAGYGLWWLVVEIVAARLDGGEPEVTYPVSKWSHLLSVRGSHVSQTLLKLAVTHLVTVVRHNDDITVRIHNLLKYRDEYSRKSGHYPDGVRTKEQKQKQIQSTAEAERKNGAPVPLPVDLRTQSEYPQTLAAIRDHDAAADPLFCVRIADTVCQAILSDPKAQQWPPGKAEKAISDPILAKAVRESYATPRKAPHGTGLLLSTVPKIILGGKTNYV